MKRTGCMLLSILLALTELIGYGVSAGAKAGSIDGIIEFGSYPQSEVKNIKLIETLNAQSAEWKSYGYYAGTGSNSDGQMTASNLYDVL